MEYSIQDIIDATVEGEPTTVQAAFDHIIGQKVMDALESRKRDLAASMFNSSPNQDDTTTHLEPEEIEDENGEEDFTSS